jgi:hypothetical protein
MRMIDTLSLSLSKEAVLVPSLEGIRTTQSHWGISTKGNYRNLLLSERNDLVSITGSLQKFNRSESLTFEECKASIYNLCETFSFEPKEAMIKRVDFAKTFKTDFEPKSYYPFLGIHRSYFRSPYKNSLNYNNSLRVLSFYDKAKEQSITGNLLRYEARFLRPEMIFKKRLYLIDLLTEEVYNHFLSSWKNDYQKIEKVKNLIPMETFRSPKQLREYLEAKGANEIGRELIYNQIKIAQRSGNLSKQNAKRMRDKLKDLSKSIFFESNELIKELDSKILTQ